MSVNVNTKLGVQISGGIVIGPSMGVQLSSPGGPTFLLRDDFTTAATAPLTSPRAAEPGPGTLTLVQTDGEFSISSGQLAFPAQVSLAWGNQYLVGAVQTRVAGRALIAKLSIATVNTFWIGYNNDATPADADVAGVDAMRLLYLAVNGTLVNIPGLFGFVDDYQAALVQRAVGMLYCVRRASGDWTLEYVSDIGSGDGYPTFQNLDAVGTLDSFRVLDLPAPFDTDYGLATQRLAGARTAGDTFTHEANCVIEFTVTTVPVGSALSVYFRIQDATNYWQLNIDSVDIAFYEVTAGSPTFRAGVSVTTSNGHRFVIVADASTIRVYSNNVLRLTYSSASNFATETDAKLETLGASGAVSEIISWPRTLTGAAAALLDGAIA